MLRLNIDRTPAWHELGFGVRVHCRFVGSTLLGAARSEAHAMARALRDDRVALILAGLDPDNLPNLEDAHVLSGVAETLLAKLLARQVIFEWQGVLAASDNPSDRTPAAVTAQTVGDLMEIPAMSAAFMAAVTKAVGEVIAEGEDCGTAPNGISEAVPLTAKDAASSDSPVPPASEATAESSAHTSTIDQ